MPLNSRCSRKCEQPCRVGVSSREPTPTQTPMLAERTPAICSVTTRRPPGRTVRRTREVTCPAPSRSRLQGAGAPTAGRQRLRPVSRPAVELLAGCRSVGRSRVARPSSAPSAARGLLDHGDQRQLAAVVDLGDLDLDLLADRDDVLDVLDALAAGQGAQLADVQQAVLAGEQRDERTEVGRLHDRAEVALADLGHRRVGDRVDGGPGGLGGLAVGGTDVDRAVVLDATAGRRCRPGSG